MPSREPSSAPPSSTTIGWNVKGTGVNGSGRLICAAITVSTVTNATAPARSAIRSARDSARARARDSSVGCIEADLSVCVQR
jgi:hypothetical protein